MATNLISEACSAFRMQTVQCKQSKSLLLMDNGLSAKDRHGMKRWNDRGSDLQRKQEGQAGQRS